MASKIEICNMALSRISAARITSLSDGTAEAVRCSLVYDICAADVMSQGTWRTCMARSSLAQTTTTPAFEWDYEYQLPVDPKFLRIVTLYNTNGLATVEYEIEGDKLLSNETTAYLKYISFLTNTEDYGPYLTNAIVSRLALELSYDITGTGEARKLMSEQYQGDLLLGLSNDGLQSVSTNVYIDTLIKDR